MLLVGAGLFLRTLRNAHAVDLGYRLESTMVADINLDVRGYSQEAGAGIYTRILDRLRTMPGVAAAGAARVTVLSGGARTMSLPIDGRPLTQDGSNGFDVRVNVVSVGYLDALGISLLRGRDFTPADDPKAPPVAIISQSLANKLWPGQDPLNRTLGTGTKHTVIGVVPDTVYRSAIERDAPPFFYLPLAQNYESGVALHVRSASGDPLLLLPQIRTAVREVDPRIVVARPQRLGDVFEQSLGAQRMMATLVAIFGALALALAAIGLYGVMAHAAGQRRAEIGIRLALGAQRASIFNLLLTDGLRLVMLGATIGLIGAFVSTKFVSAQLFGVQPGDPLTFVVGCALLTAVATLACLLPARRAMRVDPIVALRGS
jgi:predicted permease